MGKEKAPVVSLDNIAAVCSDPHDAANCKQDLEQAEGEKLETYENNQGLHIVYYAKRKTWSASLTASEKEKHPVLTVKVKSPVTSAEQEEIEDLFALVLEHYKLRGEIENTGTGNITTADPREPIDTTMRSKVTFYAGIHC